MAFIALTISELLAFNRIVKKSKHIFVTSSLNNKMLIDLQQSHSIKSSAVMVSHWPRSVDFSLVLTKKNLFWFAMVQFFITM